MLFKNIYLFATAINALPLGNSTQATISKDFPEAFSAVQHIRLAKDADSSRLAYVFLPSPIHDHKMIVIEEKVDRVIHLEYLHHNFTIYEAHVHAITQIHDALEILPDPEQWIEQIGSQEIRTSAEQAMSNKEKRWAGTSVWDLDYNLTVGDYLGHGNWKPWNAQCGCFM